MSNNSRPSPARVGIHGCCPECGSGKLFDGFLKPAERCDVCHLDFGFVDAGDGPAVFVILIVGFVVTAMAMALQATLDPAVWVHVLIWTPMTLCLSLIGLRFAKGIMISLQYTMKAKQGEMGR